MVVGMIVGPNRIPNLNVVEAMHKPGLYAFPAPELRVESHVAAIEQAGRQALENEIRELEFHEHPQPVIHYPSGLAQERTDGVTVSTPPEMPPQQAEIHQREAALLHMIVAEAGVEFSASAIAA